MDIVAALFVDDTAMRQVAGPSTRIDLTGVQFSGVAPEEPPFTWSKHLVVLVHCPTDSASQGVLEVVFRRDGEQVARNVSPLTVEPGKFSQQLVQAAVDFDEYGTVYAHCRIDQGHTVIVPYSVLPVVDGA